MWTFSRSFCRQTLFFFFPPPSAILHRAAVAIAIATATGFGSCVPHAAPPPPLLPLSLDFCFSVSLVFPFVCVLCVLYGVGGGVSQLVIEDLCELWSLFQQKLEIRLQQRFARGGLSRVEVS